jgi:hypothetical protein
MGDGAARVNVAREVKPAGPFRYNPLTQGRRVHHMEGVGANGLWEAAS